jgi:putative ABC transport system ATP-binding protein
MTLLSIQSLIVSRRGCAPLHYPDISINAGQHALLMGPSGCGKSTLLSVMAGMLPPGAGSILFSGQDIYALSLQERDRLRGAKMGFVFQNLHLIPSLSVRQNVAIAAGMANVSEDAERLDGILSTLGLAELQNRPPRALSQGEKQRAAIARAIINEPVLIIADEPTSALDDANALKVVDLLQSCARETGAALLIATHDSRLRSAIPHVIDLSDDRKAMAA